MVKVGGGIGQGPATEVTHLRLNQPPVFSSVNIVLVLVNTLTGKFEFQVHGSVAVINCERQKFSANPTHEFRSASLYYRHHVDGLCMHNRTAANILPDHMAL